jgi:transcriptional enhancer factor
VLSLLSPLRRPYRSGSLSPESHHRDSRLTYDVRPPQCESDSGSSDSSASAPATPIDTHATLQTLLYRGLESREEMPSNIVYIDLLRPGSSANDIDSSWTTPSQVAEERSLGERGYTIVRATSHPRHLRDIDPTITLLAQSMTNKACSYFTVYSEDRLIYSESTMLEPIEPRTSTVDGILYKTSLVPGFWDTISKSSGMRSLGTRPRNPSSHYILQMLHNIALFNAWFKTVLPLPRPPPSSPQYINSFTQHPHQQ